MEGLEYHQLARAARPNRWWAGILAVPLATVFLIVVAPTLVLVPFVIGFAVAGDPIGSSIDHLVDLDPLAPIDLAYLNLVLASLIPFACVVAFTLHGIKPRWLSSVAPGVRWRFFAACLALAVVALVASLIVGLTLPTPEGSDVGSGLNDFTSTTRDFLLVIVLLTPLQAAGEEYVFRGYLTQALGALFPTTADRRSLSRAVAVVVPALLFALAHGIGQPIPVFFDRLAFGLVAGVLVIATGGLEAGLAMHVLNNFLAFGFALSFGDMTDALAASEGSWWMIPATLTQSLVYLFLTLRVARSMGLSRTADPAVLAASRRRV